MKILYALQSTGNGHIVRAQEVIPVLQKYAEVDVLISGHQSQIKLNTEIKYQLSGISLIYNNKGGLSYRKILFQNNYLKAIRDIFRIPLKEYDLILNDFEPITAWACKLKGIPNIQVSHQCAMLFKETPKPKKRNFLGETVLRYYAPSKQRIGFHFESYHPEIQLPVIRKKIRELNPTKQNHYVVYLPSFKDEFLIENLNKILTNWKVFSKYTNESKTIENVEINPIDEQKFLNYFESCTGILCNAGFETPAEALFMKKKLFVIPIKNQYEQECNATALEHLGIPTDKNLNLAKIKNWVEQGQPKHLEIEDDLEEILLTKVLNL